MSEHEIALLVEMVKGTSEFVWRIAILAVYGNALSDLAWSIFMFAGWIGCAVASVRCLKNWKELESTRDNEGTRFVWSLWAVCFGIVAAIVFLVCAGFFARFVAQGVAPEAFAVKWLVLQAQ